MNIRQLHTNSAANRDGPSVRRPCL